MDPAKNNQIEKAILSQQINQFEQHINSIEAQIEELIILEKNIESLSKLKKEEKTFIPISGGVHVEGSVKPLDKLLLNVGSGVLVKKSLPEVKEIVKAQIKQLKEVKVKLEAELNKLTLKFQSIKA